MRVSRRIQTRIGLSDAGLGVCDDIGGAMVRELRGAMLWLRWLPPAAALVYALVLVRRLPSIVDQLTWNPDYVPVMALAQTIGSGGKTGHAIIVQIGYFWFDLGVSRLP